MTQLKSRFVVKPFREVKVWKASGNTLRVRATIPRGSVLSDIRTGLAVDASRSMSALFGIRSKALHSVFRANERNIVQQVARKLGSCLVDIDSSGKTPVIRFSCGRSGSEVDEIGELDAESVSAQEFSAPENPGTGTKLCPAMRYFLERFPDTPRMVCVFFTDGRIDDLDEVKRLSRSVCEEMAAGRRDFTKFVLVGVGRDFADPASAASRAFEELDALVTEPGCAIAGQGLWDYKIVADMEESNEIFADIAFDDEFWDFGAEIVDANGRAVVPENGASYNNALPTLLRFTMPADSRSFSLRLPDGSGVTQDISSLF
ncbi:MAG TPA: VWA domain-containing protein [Candidatus Akkermansia intestinigallinarum]|uniref:VWA domain-containing protein n=1 Tax=Candidatus Akkermansia intestinigallinarum TaxID=2838431 RepID=A0A9D1VCK3_9BACT|nr:VWA domain-containing protein [Candidatus Akkermansia intestinigallinarum]